MKALHGLVAWKGCALPWQAARPRGWTLMLHLLLYRREQPLSEQIVSEKCP